MIDKNLLKFGALFGAWVYVLHKYDGPWRQWTKKGQAATFDTWTLTHVIWGGIARQFDIDLFTTNILSGAHELSEAYLRKIKFLGAWGEPETAKNILVDHISTSFGWTLWDKIKDQSI